MIGFFRRIRKKLADDNQYLKYSRYAIGEILLVVIGILIALQVNNWNSNRIAVLQEITILKNLKEDINLDTLDLSFNLSYHKKFYKEEKALLDLLMLSDKYLEEMDSIDYSDALGTLLFTALHESTFANLQNNDMSLLKNNELRKKISRFYDFYYQVITNMSNNFKSFDLYQRKLPYFKKYFKVKPESSKLLLDITGEEDYFEHNLSKKAIQIRDLDGARTDESFKITLNEVLFFRIALIDFHQTVLEEIKTLNEQIDKEIGRLKKH